ncbi:DUF4156 domain-containing protein [Paracoccaceae bacterium]|nr:DUF4156 domain-containing protein [Paracoccaceae bacterium]
MRIVVLTVFGIFLTACQGTNPYGLTATSIGDQRVVSSASGQAGTGVTPVKGINYVSLHPDRLLRDARSCTKVIKLSYASNINYSEAIIGLRNRALLVGGNAISIVGWAESRTSSGLVGKIYLCKKKPFHIHY